MISSEGKILLRLKLVNIGPFEETEIELRPLTLFIGRNSLGKSLIAQTIWVLVTAVPDFGTLFEAVERKTSGEFRNLIMTILKKVKEGADVLDDFRKLTKVLVEEFHIGLAEGLKRRLEEVFGSAKALIKEGSEEARIEIEALAGNKRIATVSFVIRGDEVQPADYMPNMEFLGSISTETLYFKHLRILIDGEQIYDDIVDTEEELLRGPFAYTLLHYVANSFYPFFHVIYSALLPDSRAGIARVLLKPYPRYPMIRDVTEIEKEFLDLFHELSKAFYRGEIDDNFKDVLNELLKELGCELEIVHEAGVYVAYLRMWSGRRLHYSEAPSGIREALIVALALASKYNTMVVIEEPEAHLHPGAQRLLAKLVARAVNSEKLVVITTHSDYMFSSLNNLLALNWRSREELGKLGFKELDVLNPSDISVYLIKADNGRAVAEKLTVNSRGIPDEEFAKVVDEILTERARIEVG